MIAILRRADTYYKMRGGNLFNTLILTVDLFKLHNESASLIVLGFEPLHKSIIPRRSFFDKPHFIGLTGMFNIITRCPLASNTTSRAIPLHTADVEYAQNALANCSRTIVEIISLSLLSL
jgi:hypothetical protein